MTEVSQDFKNALAAGAAQRIALVFEDAIISNEDIDVEGGVDLREVFCSEQDLTIGLTPSSEITFAVYNDDGFYDDFEFGAFDAYIGVLLSSVSDSSEDTRRPVITVNKATRAMTVTGNGVTETYELCPLGRFIAPRPAIIRKTLIDVDAYDQMTLFDVTMPSATELGVTYPITAGNLLQALCDQANVEPVTTTFLNSTLTLASEPSSFANMTMREVLAYIAQAAGANARFNRSGKLEMAWLNPLAVSYDENQYTEFEPSWYETPIIDRLHVRNEDSTAETVIGSGNNTYMLQNNPFLRQQDVPQGFSVIVTPSRVSVYANTTMTFTAKVLGAVNPSYQWQQSANNVSWEDLPGKTASSLSLTATSSTVAYYYRVAVTSGGTVLYSNTCKAVLKGVT